MSWWIDPEREARAERDRIDAEIRDRMAEASARDAQYFPGSRAEELAEIRRRVREAAPEIMGSWAEAQARRSMRDLVRAQRERWADEREQEAAARRLAALAGGMTAGKPPEREGPRRPPVQGPDVPTTVEQWTQAAAQAAAPKPTPPAAQPEVQGPTVAPRRFRPL